MQYLRSQGLFESEAEAQVREEVLGQLQQLCLEWVCKIAEILNIGEEGSAQIFTFGSYRLGVHGPGVWRPVQASQLMIWSFYWLYLYTSESEQKFLVFSGNSISRVSLYCYDEYLLHNLGNAAVILGRLDASGCVWQRKVFVRICLCEGHRPSLIQRLNSTLCIFRSMFQWNSLGKSWQSRMFLEQSHLLLIYLKALVTHMLNQSETRHRQLYCRG